MVINVRTSMATQAAPSHVQNQDTLRMLNLRLRHANPSWVWVISDGMGGHLRGEQASHITVQVFLDHFYCLTSTRSNFSKILSNISKS